MSKASPEIAPRRDASVPLDPTSTVQLDLPAVLQPLTSLSGFATDLSSPGPCSPLDAGCTTLLSATPQPALPDAGPYPPTTPLSIEALATSPDMTLRRPAADDLNLLVGGALAPVPEFVHGITPPVPVAVKGAKTALRLPSFESLGIAAPHPDRLSRSTPPDAFGLGSSPSEGLLGGGPGSQKGGHDHGFLPASGKVPIRHFVTTITPPTENGEPAWLTTSVASAPIDSPETEPANAHPPVAAETPTTEQAPVSVQAATPLASDSGHEWAGSTVRRLLRARGEAAVAGDSLRVLSHALPSPSMTGHIYPDVIHAVHDSTPGSPTTWINVFHALPGRFNLSDMPLTSPPNTPGPAINGDDYFTQKTLFDTAVSVTDYQQDLSALPRSPRPVVPPGSINVAVVERYIPPSGHHEFASMFDPSGPSVLVDRLVELSPHRGTLVFIYPTRRGGEIFMRGYLHPVLDPTLRYVALLNDVSSEMSRTIGTMPAVAKLPDYDEMVCKMEELCQKLSDGSTAVRGTNGGAKFRVVHSETQEVVLPREVWAEDWWTKQEKPRIREAVNKYIVQAKTRATSLRDVAPGSMVSNILEQVINRPYPDGVEPQEGVEVSIFIVERTA